MFVRKYVRCVKPTCRVWRCVSCTLLLAAAFLGGCSRDHGPERVVVSGKVAYNGKAIPEGLIRFVPVEASSASVSGATIADGKYKVDSHGGVTVGTHRIEIEAYRPRKPQTSRDGGPSRFSGEQYIPRKYNAGTCLEISIQPGSPAITKNFDLTD